MRVTFSTAVFACVVAAQAFAMDKPATHAPSGPDWDSCYDLGWNRGVHVELGELPGWMEACLSGQIPFDATEATAASRTKRTHRHARSHRPHHS
ncbi:hypothetical protein [Rhodoplanes azumiensis]|uniref:Uncharacterized protein n=1 Tax=Rhodoplanes azumiensis TaxID=1897628 RepID=A0ABW5AJH5_9BRAD